MRGVYSSLVEELNTSIDHMCAYYNSESRMATWGNGEDIPDKFRDAHLRLHRKDDWEDDRRRCFGLYETIICSACGSIEGSGVWKFDE